VVCFLAVTIPWRNTRRLELLRAHLDVTDGFVLGHSHGGFVALQHALDYPGLLRGVIVYCSTPTYSPDLIAEADKQVTAFVERWPERPESIAAYCMWRARRDAKFVPTDRDSELEYMSKLLPAYFADYRKTTMELGAPVTGASF
jgi:pimeloyl-ACP methyl ester carboxylesterase